MARTANKTPKHDEPAINEQQLADDAAKLPVLAARLAEIDEQFGDGLPYDRNRYLDKCRYHMARSAEEALEVGRGLAVMREHEAHGDWLNVLASLGIEQSLSRRMIQAAVRFSNRALTHDLVAAAKSKTKLFELLVLDDEEIQQLADGGTAAGLTLDDVDSMTVSELRASLRDARAEVEDKDKLLSAKNAKLDELTAKKKRVKAIPPDEIHREIIAEVTGHMHDAAGCIKGPLRQGFITLREHEEQSGGDSREFQIGVMYMLKKALSDLALEFGLPDTPVDAAPEWLKDGPWNAMETSTSK
jgi:hypothetical protein